MINVKGLSKRYRLGSKEKQAETLAGQIGNIIKSPWTNLKRLRDLNRFGDEDDSVFWALKDINFEVKQGEVLGIIGKNGAGKSTLLKILSGITDPTTGKAEIHGRVASLLEVGTGFHPELSGRENIYMNGTILGMNRKEIDSKLDEIIDFSGVEKFIDTPVKFYSSGMKVRLGFSVAAHLEPEILIIDEVLAVGDFEFQAKCLGKMEDVSKNQGRTVLFVSHNMQAVTSLCTSAILLENSRISFRGETNLTVARYLQADSSSLNSEWVSHKGLGSIWLSEAYIQTIESDNGQILILSVETNSILDHEPAFFAVNVSSSNGTEIFQSIPQEKPFIYSKSRKHKFSVKLDLPALIPGAYNVSLWIGSHYSQTLDWRKDILQFRIEKSPMPDRSYPFSTQNGFISPNSQITSLTND